MPVVYCIGCRHYLQYRVPGTPWCSHPSGEKCTIRQFWEPYPTENDYGKTKEAEAKYKA